ncbi:MAG: hypothetical protein Q7S53_02545 [bacterium]|nr:hypothetical protein [bacterium]
MIDCLDEDQQFSIPFIGKRKYTIKVCLNAHMVFNAIREDFSEHLRGHSRRMVARKIFLDYNNLGKLPPKSCMFLKAVGKDKIREMIPELANLIDWEQLGLPQEEDEEASVPWGTCPKCGHYDPHGFGQGAACPNCS